MLIKHDLTSQRAPIINFRLRAEEKNYREENLNKKIHTQRVQNQINIIHRPFNEFLPRQNRERNKKSFFSVLISVLISFWIKWSECFGANLSLRLPGPVIYIISCC